MGTECGGDSDCPQQRSFGCESKDIVSKHSEDVCEQTRADAAFSFLQDSTIHSSPHVDPAVIAAHPMNDQQTLPPGLNVPIPSFTITNPNYANQLQQDYGLGALVTQSLETSPSESLPSYSAHGRLSHYIDDERSEECRPSFSAETVISTPPGLSMPKDAWEEPSTNAWVDDKLENQWEKPTPEQLSPWEEEVSTLTFTNSNSGASRGTWRGGRGRRTDVINGYAADRGGRGDYRGNRGYHNGRGYGSYGKTCDNYRRSVPRGGSAVSSASNTEKGSAVRGGVVSRAGRGRSNS